MTDHPPEPVIISDQFRIRRHEQLDGSYRPFVEWIDGFPGDPDRAWKTLFDHDEFTALALDHLAEYIDRMASERRQEAMTSRFEASQP